MLKKFLPIAALVALVSGVPTQAALTNGLVAYWPLDEVVGVKTPDLVHGYDMELVNLTADDLVAGRVGMAIQFDNARQTMLKRVASAGELLPINQHPALTIAMWANVVGTNIADVRLFSEASTANNDPLFNLGTASDRLSGRLDYFFRQSGWTTVDHQRSDAEPLDGTWHHLAFVQQEDGTRTLYVDGVADTYPIPAKAEGTWNVNTTTIGGILRANPTHWLSGILDEVALWNRALSETEVMEVVTTGMPEIEPPLPPLTVRSFAADLPAAAVGDTVTLRWDVTKDVEVSIDQGIGNVTAQTVSGLGSIQVPLTGTRTFTMSLDRPGEPRVSQTLTVTAVDQVAEGWTLVDNFDRYEPGPIQNGGIWADLTTTGVQITNLNGNMMAFPTTASVAAVLQLRELTIEVGEQRTLFCRLMVTDDSLSATWNGVLGVSDRPFRFGTDLDGVDIGPAIYCLDTAYPGFLGAVNGPGAVVDVAPAPIIQDNVEAVWNIWIDITNGPFPAGDPRPDTGDEFTIYVQKDGEAGRTAIFTDYLSSRNPIGAPDVGLTQEELNRMVLGARPGMSTMQNLLFDDIYLSKSGFLETVPRAFGFSEPVEGTDPPTLSVAASAGGIEITWSQGTLESSATVDGDYNPVGGATSPHTVTPTGQQQFYRVQGD